jgi:hypothetical protein
MSRTVRRSATLAAFGVAVAVAAAVAAPPARGLTVRGLTVRGLTVRGLTVLGLTVLGLTVLGLEGKLPSIEAQLSLSPQLSLARNSL